MHPLTTFERRLLCVCAPPGPVKNAAHIYPPKVDRLERRTPISLEHRERQLRRTNRFPVGITDGLPFSLGILGGHIDRFSWFGRKRRLI